MVKTIGDAAMLARTPEPAPLSSRSLGLVERSQERGRRSCTAASRCGEALPRGGDWYGRPVNLPRRVTDFARRGSVVAVKEVHDAARRLVLVARRQPPPQGHQGQRGAVPRAPAGRADDD